MTPTGERPPGVESRRPCLAGTQHGRGLGTHAAPPPPSSCPVPNAHTRVLENGSSSKARFTLKIFSFVNNSRVHLHCRLRVCVEAPDTSCRVVGVGTPGPAVGRASLLWGGAGALARLPEAGTRAARGPVLGGSPGPHTGDP